MRLKIELLAERPVKLPIGFNEYFQALIYHYLNFDSAAWLHNTGYRLEDKTFKFFAFSPFLEKGRFFSKEKFFLFPAKVSFYIASPVDWILEQFAVNISKSEYVRIGCSFPFDNRLGVHPRFFELEDSSGSGSFNTNGYGLVELVRKILTEDTVD